MPRRTALAQPKTTATTMSARAKRPAPVIAGSATGQLRVEQILETARTILVRDGHAGLSMRKVAQESGIALGHLQHFFATREALLNGLFRYASDTYDANYERVMVDLPEDPRRRFEAVLDFLLEDGTRWESRAFFFEFWVLSLRNPAAKAEIESMHAHHREAMEQHIAALNPSMSAAKRRDRAMQIAAIIDGLMVHLRTDDKNSAAYRARIADVRRTILRLAEEA